MRGARPTRPAKRSTVSAWPAALPATSTCAENASRNAPQPANASTAAKPTTCRMPSPLLVSLGQHRGEGPDQPRADALAAQPPQPQRQRGRAPHPGLELHRVERRCEMGEARARVPPKGEPRLVALDEDHLQSRSGAECTQLGHEDQALRVVREWPETIAQFLTHRLNLAPRLSPLHPPVQIQDSCP